VILFLLNIAKNTVVIKTKSMITLKENSGTVGEGDAIGENVGFWLGRIDFVGEAIGEYIVADGEMVGVITFEGDGVGENVG
jgi:hypothetical protein